MAEINVPNKQTASVTATNKKTASVSAGGNVTITETMAGVSLFIYSPYDEGYDYVYVKAPAGMIKETDKVIFARYITGKTRNRIDGGTAQGERNKYRGWIRPRYIVECKPAGYIYDDDYFMLQYSVTIKGYDFFEIFDGGKGDEIVEDLVDFTKKVTERNGQPLNVFKHKLGIAIQRDGKTIVDYMPFRIQYNGIKDRYAACRV